MNTLQLRRSAMPARWTALAFFALVGCNIENNIDNYTPPLELNGDDPGNGSGFDLGALAGIPDFRIAFVDYHDNEQYLRGVNKLINLTHSLEIPVASYGHITHAMPWLEADGTLSFYDPYILVTHDSPSALLPVTDQVDGTMYRSVLKASMVDETVAVLLTADDFTTFDIDPETAELETLDPATIEFGPALALGDDWGVFVYSGGSIYVYSDVSGEQKLTTLDMLGQQYEVASVGLGASFNEVLIASQGDEWYVHSFNLLDQSLTEKYHTDDDYDVFLASTLLDDSGNLTGDIGFISSTQHSNSADTTAEIMNGDELFATSAFTSGGLVAQDDTVFVNELNDDDDTAQWVLHYVASTSGNGSNLANNWDTVTIDRYYNVVTPKKFLTLDLMFFPEFE